MAKRSKTVQKAIDRLWATMAEVAARKAIQKIRLADDANAAERWADTAIGWMEKSSAEAIAWHYSHPRTDS